MGGSAYSVQSSKGTKSLIQPFDGVRHDMPNTKTRREYLGDAILTAIAHGDATRRAIQMRVDRSVKYVDAWLTVLMTEGRISIAERKGKTKVYRLVDRDS